ncbi:hypothetical protein predicted by Glimmer/Critica [Acetobacter ghanensis]|uniref:Uncharacterized protein n=1 Tax=Acetobacter ghanensis TaxID=431306 RepID=A0A0U5BL87_9PROT|nr:hypothetical protein predicted by Glimmer/Critica [Acetobacter ghanensis]
MGGIAAKRNPNHTRQYVVQFFPSSPILPRFKRNAPQ